MSIVSQVKLGTTLYDIQSIEFITGTQAASTNAWLGTTKSAALESGKIIVYKLPYDGTSSNATLNLTLAGGSTTGAKNVLKNGTENVTDEFSANQLILMLYNGTAWQVLGGDSGGDIVTTSENFVKTVTATTSTVSTAVVNGITLVISAPTVVTSITSTSGSAITAVANDANIANAYGEFF